MNIVHGSSGRDNRMMLGAALAVGIAACGAPTAPPTATSSGTTATTQAAAPTTRTAPTPSAPSSATPAGSPSAAASATATTFVSTRYKYALTLPADSLFLVWHSAERPWDGQAKVDMAGPYPDRNAIAEGGLLLIGSAAEGLEEFFGRFEANGTRFHGCGPAQNRRDLTVRGVPAIGFTQVCETGASFGRVALFKDGWGIAAYISSAPGAEMAALERLIQLLDGLEWRTG